jgi:hypothetical protein
VNKGTQNLPNAPSAWKYSHYLVFLVSLYCIGRGNLRKDGSIFYTVV